MSIYQGLTKSFRQELLGGTHDLDTDVLKIALYGTSASLGPDTTVYTSTGEITGTGYTAAGKTVTAAISQAVTHTEVVFSDVTWEDATVTAYGALIYNSSKSNKAILVLNFGGARTVTAADFVVRFPAAGTDYPVLKLGT